MVTRTINDLFFVVNVRGVQIPVSSLLKGGLAGFFASLLAAAPPAWEAASVPPRLALSRAGLESKAQLAVRLVARIGVLAALIGAIILAIRTRSLVVSFTGTFAMVIGLVMLSPWVTATFMHLLSEPLSKRFGLLGRLAPRNVVRSQSRTAVAVAALMIAVAVTIGVQVMIASFRTTVTIWLEETLRGDVYVASQSFRSNRLDTPLDPRVVSVAEAYPSVRSSIGMRVAMVESKSGPLEVVATSPERPLDPRLFLAAEANPWQRVKDGAILLSEPLANRLGIAAPGGSISLLTPRGWRAWRISPMPR
jgi:putative ABC transport system permease protein